MKKKINAPDTIIAEIRNHAPAANRNQVRVTFQKDQDDSHAYGDDPKSFALLIRGVQPKGNEAATALTVLKKAGITGYSKNKKEVSNAV